MRRTGVVLAGWVGIFALLIAQTYQQSLQDQQPQPQHEPLGPSSGKEQLQAARRQSVPYFRASIPMRIYECLQELSILRCTKLFVLQKMEVHKQFPNTGNLTKDFIEQFFGDEQHMGSLINENYRQLPEEELNQRLVVNFQRFFKNRDIKLHFLPGMLVKIVPSKENKLKFTLKKKTKPRMGRSFVHRESNEGSLNMNPLNLSGELDAEAEGDSKQQIGLAGGGHGSSGGGLGGGGGIGSNGNDGGIIGKRKNKKQSYKTAMLQMAVPILVMPAILLGSMLPFVLPALKMATIMSLLMNNGAFLAALIYAARAQANSQDEQHVNYGYSGYH